jgi:hypothetical protein
MCVANERSEMSQNTENKKVKNDPMDTPEVVVPQDTTMSKDDMPDKQVEWDSTYERQDLEQLFVKDRGRDKK